MRNRESRVEVLTDGSARSALRSPRSSLSSLLAFLPPPSTLQPVMIEIDRDAPASVREQLVEQLRYRIASGQYKVDETLPSTRKMGKRLGISFHTVRKAYRELVDEGLLESRVGSGYTVKDRAPLEKSERMERGATVVNEALQRLIGLGLSEEEVEYLFQEQTGLLDHAGLDRKLLLVGPHPEINALCADQVATRLQRSVRPVALDDLDRHQDADFVFTPYVHLNQALRAVPRGDVLGFVTHLPSDVLERVARLRDDETLALITRRHDSIPPLTQRLRRSSSFGGQVIGASIEDGTEHLDSFLDETDFLLYTPASRRRLLPLLDADAPARARVTVLVSQDSLDAIAEAVPA